MNDRQSASRPFVTIAIPVLNEAAHIETCIEMLMPQLEARDGEVMVLDGGSRDETRAIVTRLMARHSQLRLVDNPERLQSAACNLAARLADPRSSVLVRADAHALYPPDFLELCLHDLVHTGATSVVVPMQTVGTDGFQRAVAAAQNSKLGNGGSAHRAGGVSGFVDHGHHAAFDLAFFRKLGGYNKRFSHNEDAELDLRANRAGGRVWMCRAAAITYIPRRTPMALARQYLRHGAGRARTLMLHGVRPRPRQMAPVVILAGIIGSFVLAPVLPWLLLLPLLYVTMCCIWGAVAAIGRGDGWLLAMGPAAMIMHLAWAAGFVREVATQLVSGKAMREQQDLAT